MTDSIDFTAWLVGGETGISSIAIVAQLTGLPTDREGRADHPHDPDDFTRCAKLLAMYPDAVPVFRERMPSRSPVWAALVARWDDIHQTLEEEVPGFLDGAYGRCPRTYDLMRSVIDSANKEPQP